MTETDRFIDLSCECGIDKTIRSEFSGSRITVEEVTDIRFPKCIDKQIIKLTTTPTLYFSGKHYSAICLGTKLEDIPMIYGERNANLNERCSVNKERR